MARDQGTEVVFVTAGSTQVIRLMDKSIDNICETARALNAHHFVVALVDDPVEKLPIWEVFDIRAAQRNNPLPGCWCLGDAMRAFRSETSDAAVMYALACGR